MVFRASPDWGTPDHFLPQPTELELKDSKTDPGCSYSIRKAALALLKWGLYVCPGGHRDQSLARGCVNEKDFIVLPGDVRHQSGIKTWQVSRKDLITVPRQGSDSKV